MGGETRETPNRRTGGPANRRNNDGLVLGIEGGATRSIALWADASGRIIYRRESGPLNIKLATDAQLLHRLREFTQFKVRAVALCFAGCRILSDRARVRAL